MNFKSYLVGFSFSIGAISTFGTASVALAVESMFRGEALTTLGNSSSLVVNPNKISGSGSFVYKTTLNAIGSDTSHALSFSIKDGGQLNFITYSNDFLGEGLAFVFSRVGNVLKAVIVKKGDFANALDISSVLANVNASRIVNLQIDVHNSESPAHVLVWDGLEVDFSEDKALVNTEEIAAGAPGSGDGMHKGFILRDASLLKAITTPAKFEH